MAKRAGRPLNSRKRYAHNPNYIKRRYEPITKEYLAQMDDKYNGGVSFYTNVVLDFIETMYDGFGLPIHQKRFANRRSNFIHFGINMTQYLDYLHENKKLVQILLPSGSLLYFPAKVIDKLSQDELLGSAIEAEEIMRAKQREGQRMAAIERAERARMRKVVRLGSDIKQLRDEQTGEIDTHISTKFEPTDAG